MTTDRHTVTTTARTRPPRSAALDRRLATRGRRVLGDPGQGRRPPQPDLLRAQRAHRLLGLEPVVGAGALPRARATASTRRRSSCSPPCRPWSARCCGSRTPSRSAGSAAATGRSSPPCCCWSRPILIAIFLEPGVSFNTLLVVSLFAGCRRRQLRLLDDQHQRLLPGPAEGLGAGHQRRRRQPRRARGPAGRAARAGHARDAAPAGHGRDLHPADHPGRRRRGPVHGQPDPEQQRQGGHPRGHAGTRETWIMALLYIGTFGSFIGFGFAFGQVLLVQFPDAVPHPGQGGRADLPRPAARLADPAVRRRAGRPVQGVGGHLLQLHRHGAGAVHRAGRLPAELAAAVHLSASCCCSSSAASATGRPTR